MLWCCFRPLSARPPEPACAEARTALFNWLYAKSVGGDMVLRIEDGTVSASWRVFSVSAVPGS